MARNGAWRSGRGAVRARAVAVAMAVLGTASVALAPPAHAATLTWTGGSAASDDWSDPANWSGGVAPTAGDTLAFPASVPVEARPMVADLPGPFAELQFADGDWSVGAEPGVTLDVARITAAGASDDADVHLAPALAVDGDLAVSASGAIYSDVFLDGPLVGVGDVLLVDPADGYTRVTATPTFEGSFVLDASASQLVLAADATQPVEVRAGNLEVNGTSGPVTGTGVAFVGGAGTIVGEVSLGGGLYPGDPTGLDHRTLTVDGDLHLLAPGGHGILEVGADGGDSLAVTGVVTIDPEVSLSFDGTAAPDGHVAIDNRGDQPIAGTFTNLPDGGTVTIGEDTFVADYQGGDGNDLVISRSGATHTWDGGGDDARWTTAANWVGDAAPAPGATLVFPVGAARLATENDFPDGTAFDLEFRDSGYSATGNAVEARSLVGADDGCFDGGEEDDVPADELELALPLVVPAGGLLVDPASCTLDLAGALSGPGAVTLGGEGVNELVISGSGPDVEVDVPAEGLGFLHVDGTVGAVTAAGVVVNGSGTVASLTVTGGAVEAGPDYGSVGTLTVLGDLRITGAGHFAPTIDPLESDRFVVGGALLIDGSSARFDNDQGGGGADSYTLVDGASPFDGTFDGFPEGSIVQLGGRGYRLSYVGGDGFDLTLTAIGESTWDGGSTSTDAWSEAANWLGDVAPEPGATLVFPEVSGAATSTNDFPEATPFAVRFTGAHVVGGAPFVLLGLFTDDGITGAEVAADLDFEDERPYAHLGAGATATLRGALRSGYLEVDGTGTLVVAGDHAEGLEDPADPQPVATLGTSDRSGTGPAALVVSGDRPLLHVEVEEATAVDLAVGPAARLGVVEADGGGTIRLAEGTILVAELDAGAGRLTGVGTVGALRVDADWVVAPGSDDGPGAGRIDVGSADIDGGTIEIDVTPSAADELVASGAIRFVDAPEGRLVLEGTGGAASYAPLAGPDGSFVPPTVPADGATVDLGGVGYLVDHTGSGTTLTRVEDPPTGPTVSIADASTVEGLDADFVISLSESPTANVTVDFQTVADGTAGQGVDFTATNGEHTFTPGGALTFTVDVPTTADDVDERLDLADAASGDETFAVEITQAEATVLDGRGVGTIADDDEAILSVGGGGTVEEGGTVEVSTSLSTPTVRTVTGTIAATGGTATAEDHAGSTGFAITPGEVGATVSVATTDDALDERDESVTFAATDVDGAEADVSTATATITDDDPAPTISTAEATVAVEESDGAAVVTVVLSAPRGFDTVLDWATGAPGDSATAGEDYEAAAGQLVVPAGETTGSVTIAVTQDDADEPQESFTVTFTEGVVVPAGRVSAQAAGDPVAAAVVQIADDDLAVAPGGGATTTSTTTSTTTAPTTPPPPTTAPPGAPAAAGVGALVRTGGEAGATAAVGLLLLAGGVLLAARRRGRAAG